MSLSEEWGGGNKMPGRKFIIVRIIRKILYICRGGVFKMKYHKYLRLSESWNVPRLHKYSEIVIEGNKSSLEFGKDFFARNFFSIRLADGKIKFGNNVFFNNQCSVNCLGKIEIGDNTMFGENVKLYDHNHIYSDATKPYCSQGWTTGEIIIGENCWVGSNSVILKNVHIGDNSIIGAGCVVYKNVPENSILLSDGTVRPIVREISQ